MTTLKVEMVVSPYDTFKTIQRLARKYEELHHKSPNYILCGIGVRDAYVQHCVNDKRFVNTVTAKDGSGRIGVEYSGFPLIVDYDLAQNEIVIPEP